MPSTFSVFFNGELWVGVLEVADADEVRATQHVFGAEPGGAELADFVRRHFDRLLDAALATQPVEPDRRPAVQRVNPKRAARMAA